MPVRIFFRGLVLFRFPTEGDDAGKLVAELITEPTGPAARPGPHHHQTEIQILTGAQHVPPTPLPHGRRIEITIPGQGAVSRSASFESHVPKLSELAGGRPAGSQNRDFIRNTITVNRGVIRVRNLVTWDSGGFPIAGNAGETAAQLAEIKFLGVDRKGHMANECVLEVLDADRVDVQVQLPERKAPDAGNANENAEIPGVSGPHVSVLTPNPHTARDTVEILVNSFEFQRAKPVPWAMDFQWLFLAAGYNPVNLSGRELAEFRRWALSYDTDLYDEDRRTLLPTDTGLPFPYIVGGVSGVSGNELAASPTALSEIDCRPLCVPGDGE